LLKIIVWSVMWHISLFIEELWLARTTTSPY
jgi:hypothetical protein